MKLIKKGQEPQEFLAWKNKASDDWKPTYSNLGGSVKKALNSVRGQKLKHLVKLGRP